MIFQINTKPLLHMEERTLRKIYVLSMICFLFLSGCNDVKDVKEAIKQEFTLQSAVDQIGVIVDKRNALESKIEKSPQIKAYEESTKTLDKSLEEGNFDKKLFDKVLEDNDKTRKEYTLFYKELQAIESEIKQTKSKLTNKLSKEDDTTVQQILDQFAQLVAVEIEYYKTTAEYYKELDQYYKDMKADQEPNEEKTNQLEKKLSEQEEKLDQYVDTFSQKWNKLHKDTRGENLEDAK